jgi:hypothetical protein
MMVLSPRHIVNVHDGGRNYFPPEAEPVQEATVAPSCFVSINYRRCCSPTGQTTAVPSLQPPVANGNSRPTAPLGCSVQITHSSSVCAPLGPLRGFKMRGLCTARGLGWLCGSCCGRLGSRGKEFRHPGRQGGREGEFRGQILERT